MKRCFFILLLLILLITLFAGFFVKNVSADGNEGEPCINGDTCLNNLICTYPGRQYSKCQTQEKIDEENPSYGQNNFPVGKLEIFCEKGQRDSGILTAIGCINTTDTNSFIASILRVATGIGGGLALAMILFGVFIVTTSAGIPDKLKAGSEIITSAVIGLIFILLSIVIMNIIGINILGLPGLS